MNNREIRNALASVFLELQLTVRVKHARSTDSVYMTISNDNTSYVIRIANHRSTYQYSQIHDYWIDTSKPNLVESMNAAIKGAEVRFEMRILEAIPEKVEEIKEKAPERVSEEVPQISDYSNQLCADVSRSMINLEQYYLSSQGIVSEIGHEPSSGAIPSSDQDEDKWGRVVVMMLIILLVVFYFV